MAKTKINGRRIWLFVDTTTPVTTALDAVTPANFRPVVCLTSNSLDVTVNPIETTSKCDDGNASSEAGTMGWTMNADGIIAALTAPDTDAVSAEELLKIVRSKEPKWWAQMDVDALGASTLIRYGVGRIDSYNETWADNESGTFTGAVTGIGALGDQDDMDVA